MIESIQFKNFKALRDATLPLSRFTLIVGPNGSGKSTALQALKHALQPGLLSFDGVISAGCGQHTAAEIIIEFMKPFDWIKLKNKWVYGNHHTTIFVDESNPEGHVVAPEKLLHDLTRIRLYSLDAQAIATPWRLQKIIELMPNGGGLVVVLDQLRDNYPERFEMLNEALCQWLPEFDRILFETPNEGHRAFLLRTRKGRHAIPASSLSQGTLLAVAMLTLAYLPDPPSVICLEEPDRGIHPRLLRDVQDALYRLSYPESAGEQREPVQVIATTHSPHLLDLYRDHTEEIVLANKTEEGVQFERLSDQPYIDEILRDSQLGEIWYAGILGGVPQHA